MDIARIYKNVTVISVCLFFCSTCFNAVSATGIPCNINLTNTEVLRNPASGSYTVSPGIPATVLDDIVKTYTLEYSTWPSVIVSDSAYLPAVVDMYNGTSSLKAPVRTTMGIEGLSSGSYVNMSASGNGSVVTLTPANGIITSPSGSYSLKGRKYGISFTPVVIPAGLYSGVHQSWCKSSVSAGAPVTVTLSTGAMPTGTFHIDSVSGGRLYTDTVGNGWVNPATSSLNFTEVPVISLTALNNELNFGTLNPGTEKGLPLNIELTSNTISQPVTITWSFTDTLGQAEFRVEGLGNQLTETVNTGPQKNTPLTLIRTIVIKGRAAGSYEGVLSITATLS